MWVWELITTGEDASVEKIELLENSGAISVLVRSFGG
jgi:hypothetical protein